MNNQQHRSLIIVGSGPAGLTAAIYAARANLRPLVIQGSKPGGQLMNTTYVENWPGNISILGPQLMMNMMEHARHFGAEFVAENVERVQLAEKPFMVQVGSGAQFTGDALIIATGAEPRKLGCPGEQEYWSKGVTTCAVCDGAFFPDKRVLIVGGGDTAMEDASFLKKFTKKITIVQNLPQLSASFAMQQRVLNDPDISIIYQHTVTEIVGDGTRVTGARIKDLTTGSERILEVDGIFLAIGLTPNSRVFADQLACNAYGYVDVKDHTKTSVEGVFCAGDLHDYHYRQAITAAGNGCMAALDAERYLSRQGL